MTETTAIALDPNFAMVIMGVIGIVVPLSTLLVNFIQNSRIAREQAATATRIATDQSARASLAEAEVRNVAVKVEDARRVLAANTSAATVAVRDVATKVEQARQDSAVTRAAVAVEVAAVAEKVEEARLNVAAHVDQKLDSIQKTLINGPLTQALATIEEMKRLLQSLAPNDARVLEILSR